MKNLVYSFFFIALALFTSCSEESGIEETHLNDNISIKFHIANSWDGVSKDSETINIDALLTNRNGNLEIISDEIIQKTIRIDGEYRTMYQLGQESSLDPIEETEKSFPLKTGYLWFDQGGSYGCFVYSLYIEDSSGNTLILDTCSNLNCVGFGPICGDYT